MDDDRLLLPSQDAARILSINERVRDDSKLTDAARPGVGAFHLLTKGTETAAPALSDALALAIRLAVTRRSRQREMVRRTIDIVEEKTREV